MLSPSALPQLLSQLLHPLVTKAVPMLHLLVPKLHRLFNQSRCYWQWFRSARSSRERMVRVPFSEWQMLRQRAQEAPLLEALLEEADDEITQLQKQVENLKSENGKLKNQLGQANGKVAQLQKQVENLKSENGKLKNQLGQANDEIAQLQKQVGNLGEHPTPRKRVVCIIGGHPKSERVLKHFEDRFVFEPFPSERHAGRNAGTSEKIKAAVHKADAVIFVTNHCGHCKSRPALKACRSMGKPYRSIRNLTVAQLRRALSDLFGGDNYDDA